MPSAMSRLSDPVGIVSMSIALEFLPSRMIEPLPNARSIWDSAASSAFDLSMEAPSTTRSAGWAIDTLLMTMILRVDNAGCGPSPGKADTVHYLFSVRNMFFAIRLADLHSSTIDVAHFLQLHQSITVY